MKQHTLLAAAVSGILLGGSVAAFAADPCRLPAMIKTKARRPPVPSTPARARMAARGRMAARERVAARRTSTLARPRMPARARAGARAPEASSRMPPGQDLVCTSC